MSEAEREPEPRFAVGIDLGTTHCVMAAAALARPSARIQDVPQLVAPGEVAARPLLPSFLYLPAPGELDADELLLPWGPSDPYVTGELAVRLGARTPGRLVASAKSWVCHGGVNRRAPILPWNGADEGPHVSPYAAEVAYLAHLRSAWEARRPDAPLDQQDVVVTVPASFDEAARELTAEAAREAGLGSVRLLEEPQAAFYDFFGAHADTLAERLGDARLVLVVDVGGGTTDLTLLQVLAREPGEERPRIERIAVGGHLMLGGDNMDAALATFALEQAGLPRPDDATVWSGLVLSARHAKERLLGDDAPDEVALTLTQRGSRLVAGTRSLPLRREDAERILLDGFLPKTGPDEVAERSSRAGLTTLGLPYTKDTAIGRHVCAFLRRHVDAAARAGARVRDGLPRPDRLLLNGGVFKAATLVRRLGEVLEGWYGEPVPVLEHTSLDTAVARGAVRFALARRGAGELIGGGSARAYYIGIEGPGGEREALCIAPRGMDEGVTIDVPGRVFDLLLDRPVAFPLYAYTGDRHDAAGTLVTLDLADADGELEPLPWLETVLRFKGERGEGEPTVPVTLAASMTDKGALELYLVTIQLPPRRWRLEFSLAPGSAGKAASGSDAASDEDDEPGGPIAGRMDEARALFAARMHAHEARAVKSVRTELEAILGPRGQWTAATCRALFESCLEHRDVRATTEPHELNWLRVAGWCLRPGLGVAGDDARVAAAWASHAEGLQQRSKANWAEWWIFWRRIAAGLDATQQQALFDDVRPYLLRDVPPPPGPHAHGLVEMMQLAAALERLPSTLKQATGELSFARPDKLGAYWPLARLGARALLHGDTADVLAPDVASAWLRRLLALDWSAAEGASFAAASIARKVGDPSRDVGEDLREAVAQRLRKERVPASWIELVEHGAELSEGDARRLLGDSLPVGLRLS